MWLIWPFAFWGFLVVLCGAIGCTLLSDVTGPIALFNIVNYVNVGVVVITMYVQLG